MTRIDKVTLAVNDLKSMSAFYSALLQIEMAPWEFAEQTLSRGTTSDFELLLCPRALAQVPESIARNTVQLRIVVDNVRAATERALAHGGSTLGDLQIIEGREGIGLMDPEGNSLELISAGDVGQTGGA